MLCCPGTGDILDMELRVLPVEVTKQSHHHHHCKQGQGPGEQEGGRISVFKDSQMELTKKVPRGKRRSCCSLCFFCFALFFLGGGWSPLFY